MSPAEHQPRRRIIDAALRLTSCDGYQGVQVRALSELAGVSSRTIYEQFSSLDAVIVVAVGEAYEELYARLTRSPPRGPSALARVDQVVAEFADTMTANRTLTVALLRAFLSGKSDVADHVRTFGDMLEQLLASAIAPSGPGRRDREIAKVIATVCFSSLIFWATGGDTDVDAVVHDVASAMLPPVSGDIDPSGVFSWAGPGTGRRDDGPAHPA